MVHLKTSKMKTLDALIVELIKSEIKGFSSLSRPHKLLFKIKITSLKEEDLDILKSEMKNHPAISIFIESVLTELTQKQNFIKLKEEQRLHRNESVKDLLTLYANKKSGKVVDSRKKLQQRYVFMSYKEQLPVMKAMLQGTKTDREWCYNILRKHWSEEFEYDILSAWEDYHEERCGWLITKNCSVEIIKEYIDELCYNSNYYGLCKRLVSEYWFKIDKDKLQYNCGSDEKYLWIVSQRQLILDEKEAMEFVYKRIVGAIFHNDTDSYPDDRFSNRELTNLYFTCIYGRFEDNFYMCNIKGMDKILKSLCCLGFEDAVHRFIENDQKLHDEFLNKIGNKQTVGGLLNMNAYKSYLKKFVQYYAASFPCEYKYVFDKYENFYMRESDCNKMLDEDYNVETIKTEYVTSQKNSERKMLSKEEFENIKLINPKMRFLIERLSLEPVEGEGLSLSSDIQ